MSGQQSLPIIHLIEVYITQTTAQFAGVNKSHSYCCVISVDIYMTEVGPMVRL